MSDIEDLVKVLQGWRDQDSKTILQVLQRINQMKAFPANQLDILSKNITEFHRDIGKAGDDEVDPKWFSVTIQIKKRLKKVQDTQKQKAEKPKLQKKPSIIINFPETLTIGRGPNDQQMLKSLYKNFLTFFDEGASDTASVTFIQATLKELKYLFEDKPEESLHKRINSICNRLARENCKQAKEKMLRGEISPGQLALDDEQIYFDEKARENIRKNQLAQLQASRTGFYDEMKKNINKDACQECRFCRKRNAFCEDMKQIRASDEPMTRFMRCNACNKQWRD